MAYDNYFQQYGNMYGGTSPAELSEIARLESGYRPNVMNNWDSNADAGTPSGGIMQFIQPTFSGYLRAAQADRPGVYGRWSAQDWMDPEAQIAVAAHAIGEEGKGSAWATYDRARGGGQSTGREGIKYGGSAPASSGGSISPLFAHAFADDPEIGAMLESRLGSLRAAPQGGRGGAGGRTAIDPFTGGYDWKDMPRRKGEAPWQWFQRIGQQKFGLRNDPGNAQTTGGQHAAGSPHYAGQAIDFGDARNTREQLNAANAYYQTIPGVSTIWQQPGHYNHLDVRVG